jgi:leucyl/phenylalanyl-tRNA---protein transferase
MARDGTPSPLTPELLLRVYAAGIFPMAEDADDPALHWVDPDERGVLPLDGFHVSRSLQRRLRRNPFDMRVDSAFDAVVAACAQARFDRPTTWINAEIRHLVSELHRMGHAHSVESWRAARPMPRNWHCAIWWRGSVMAGLSCSTRSS